jgi:hypothetical protein
MGMTEGTNAMALWGAGSGHIDVAVQEAVAVVTLRRPASARPSET